MAVLEETDMFGRPDELSLQDRQLSHVHAFLARFWPCAGAHGPRIFELQSFLQGC